MNTRLVELWNAGVSVKEIAKELGCSERYVYVYASRHRDLCIKRSVGRKKIDKNKLVKLWNTGVPVDEIAQKLGCNRSTVYVYVNRYRDICPKRVIRKTKKVSKEKLATLWKAGVSVDEIAHELGCSRQSVYGYAERHQDICPNRDAVKKVDKEKLAVLWKAGVSVDEIAQELGCHRNTVYVYARKYKDICPKREKNRKEKVDEERLVELWKSGVSTKKIAQELGCSRQTIYRYTKSHRDLCSKRRAGRKS